MKFKTMLVGLVTLVVFVGMAVSAFAAMELKLAHYGAETHPSQTAALMFAENVEKRTNGEIKIIVYPNNALGAPPEMLEQAILGIVDMVLPTQGQLDKYAKPFAGVMLPFAYQSYQHAYSVIDSPEFVEWVSPMLEKENLIFLSNWEWGFRHATNNLKPIKTPEDLKGMKIRVPGEIQLRATFEACGSVVTSIAFNELYMAMKQGVVDGQENPISVIYSNKLYETQKYLSLTKHSYNSMVHVIGKKTWEKLTPEQQQIVKEESENARDYFRKVVQEQEAAQIAELEKLGMIVNSDVDFAAFEKALEPAYKQIEEYAGAENIKKYKEIVEQYRQK